MNIQVLVAAMNQQDYSLPEKMNISTDAIIGNQCDRNSFEETDYSGHKITYINTTQRGVGFNRNIALFRATAEVCLFADDDVVYEDNYEETVKAAYEKHPDADVIIFNLKRISDKGTTDIVKSDRKIGLKGVSAYGTVTVSVRTESIRKKNICFHTMFGGGTAHSCGEDTVFLHDCAKNKLNIYTCSDTIGKVYDLSSSWFSGYNDKFFEDKGVLYSYMFPVLSYPLCFYHVLKHRSLYGEYGVKKAIKKMLEGAARGI